MKDIHAINRALGGAIKRVVKHTFGYAAFIGMFVGAGLLFLAICAGIYVSVSPTYYYLKQLCFEFWSAVATTQRGARAMTSLTGMIVFIAVICGFIAYNIYKQDDIKETVNRGAHDYV